MLFGKLFTNPKMWVNGDADEITMGGVYTCKDVQNVPTGDGALLVFKTENTVKQVFIPVGEEGVVYTRVLGEDWASVTGTSEETEALIQSAIDKANQAQAKADTIDTRLNNIIIESGTSEAEVVAARTDSNGQTFTTLGKRLDTQFGEINSINKSLTKYAKIVGINSPTANVSWGYKVKKPLALFMYKQDGITASTFTVNVYKKDNSNTPYYDDNIRRDYITLVSTYTFNKDEFVVLENLDTDTYIEIVFTAREIKYTTDTEAIKNLKGLLELGNYGIRSSVFMYSSNTRTFGYGRLAGEYVIIPKNKVESVLNGKSIACIGDSITEYNFRAGTNWIMWLEKWCECTIQNLGQSGRGFVNDFEGTSYITKIPLITGTPDIIGVSSSFNDIYTGKGTQFNWATETGQEAGKVYIDAFWDALISAYPTTPIICYCEGPWYNAKPYTALSDGYIETVRKSCREHGVPFYEDLYYGCALKPWLEANRIKYFTSDNIKIGNTGVVDNKHPNTEGHKIIARYLIEKFANNIVGEWLDYT